MQLPCQKLQQLLQQVYTHTGVDFSFCFRHAIHALMNQHKCLCHVASDDISVMSRRADVLCDVLPAVPDAPCAPRCHSPSGFRMAPVPDNAGKLYASSVKPFFCTSHSNIAESMHWSHKQDMADCCGDAGCRLTAKQCPDWVMHMLSSVLRCQMLASGQPMASS